MIRSKFSFCNFSCKSSTVITNTYYYTLSQFRHYTTTTTAATSFSPISDNSSLLPQNFLKNHIETLEKHLNNNNNNDSNITNVTIEDKKEEISDDQRRRIIRDELILEWSNSDLFQDPDKEQLSSNVALLCRWLVLSGELMMGEDHVDWCCVELNRLLFLEEQKQKQNAAKEKEKISPQLCLQVIKSLEKWVVKETPECLVLASLLDCLASHFSSSSSVSSSVCTAYSSFSEKKEIQNITLEAFTSISQIFRKISKGEQHFPIPEKIDVAMANLVTEVSSSFCCRKNEQNNNSISLLLFDSWITTMHQFLKLGARRFPLTLYALLESVISSSFSPPSFYYSVLIHRFQSDSYLTRNILDAILDSLLVVSPENKNQMMMMMKSPLQISKFLSHQVLFSVLVTQMYQYPLNNVGVLTSVCLRCFLLSSSSNEEQKEKEEETATTMEKKMLRSLLIMSLRCSYFGFLSILQNHPSQGNVESAMCANKFLSVIIVSSSTSTSHHHHDDSCFVVPKDILESASEGVNEENDLTIPAKMISNRFPHLKKK